MSTTIYRVQITTSPEHGDTTRALYLTGDELDELGGFLDQLAAGPIVRDDEHDCIAELRCACGRPPGHDQHDWSGMGDGWGTELYHCAGR